MSPKKFRAISVLYHYVDNKNLSFDIEINIACTPWKSCLKRGAHTIYVLNMYLRVYWFTPCKIKVGRLFFNMFIWNTLYVCEGAYLYIFLRRITNSALLICTKRDAAFDVFENINTPLRVFNTFQTFIIKYWNINMLFRTTGSDSNWNISSRRNKRVRR